MKNVVEKDAYENLANAIVEQAAIDYADALKAYYKAKADMKELESFFKSEYYQSLTDVDGESLMKAIKAEALRKTKNR